MFPSSRLRLNQILINQSSSARWHVETQGPIHVHSTSLDCRKGEDDWTKGVRHPEHVACESFDLSSAISLSTTCSRFDQAQQKLY